MTIERVKKRNYILFVAEKFSGATECFKRRTRIYLLNM